MDFYRHLVNGLDHYGALTYGRATGGSTTTLIDTNISEDAEPEDFEEGTLFVIRDAGGASAAPEGQFSRVTTFAPSTSTFTVADTLTAAIASGDRYAVTGDEFHHDELIELANSALLQLGDVSLENTSITTADNQTEYTLPVALKQYKTLDIFYNTRLNDANDNRWRRIRDWDVSYTAGGATALLYLPQLPASRTVRIIYWGQHPTLNAYSDDVSEYIHPVLARASLVERLANRAVTKSQHSVPSQRISYDKAASEFQEALRKYPINKHSRKPFLTTLHRVHDTTFTAGKVQL